MPSSAPLIKGYLPVRLTLPSTWSQEHEDDTFFYVREHQGKVMPSGSDQSKAENSKKKSVLFVSNAPVVPGISTRVLLHSIFGRFGKVSRVTVVQNPRGEATASEKHASLQWTSRFRDLSFLPPILSEGKFAHVVFTSPKEMKKTLRALNDVMKQPAKGKTHAGLSLEPIEIQTLSDESTRQYREARRKELNSISGGGEDDEDYEESDDEQADHQDLTGIHAVVQQYRNNRKELSRSRLLQECNIVMKAYEDAEEEKRRAQELAKSQPDDDGFVTVSYSSAVGSQVELEESHHATAPVRRKGQKRSRKKKEPVGSKELDDFYRFQRRENKKRTLEDLRAQFEEDLKRVKRMKDEHKYKPF